MVQHPFLQTLHEKTDFSLDGIDSTDMPQALECMAKLLNISSDKADFLKLSLRSQGARKAFHYLDWEKESPTLIDILIYIVNHENGQFSLAFVKVSDRKRKSRQGTQGYSILA